MRLVKSKRIFNIIVVAIILVWLSGFIFPAYVFGQSPEQRDLFDSGVYKFDIEVGPICGPVSADQNRGVGGVFYIGDSLTVGMVGSGGLLEKTSAAGYTVDSNLTTDTSSQKSGPSVEATQGYVVSNTIENLATDTNRFSEDRVSIIVVMLGTNPESNQTQSTQELIAYLREFNSTAEIYWVNTFAERGIDYGAINSAIEQGVSQSGDSSVDVIDFASRVNSNDINFGFASDGIHHTPTGYGLKADFVIDELPGGTTENTSENSCGGVVPAGTGDNDVDLINSLKNSGMTIEQAIGVLANVYHESGNNPKRQECVYSVEDGLDKGIPREIMEDDGAISSANQRQAAQILLDGDRCAIIDGRRVKTTVDGYGWGLVQWTSANKIIGVSSDNGVPYVLIDSMQYQADFLISQLRGESVGLLIEFGVDAGTAEANRNSGFFNTNTPEDAAEYFAINYERCARCRAGNPEITKRRSEASQLFIEYGSL